MPQDDITYQKIKSSALYEVGYYQSQPVAENDIDSCYLYIPGLLGKLVTYFDPSCIYDLEQIKSFTYVKSDSLLTFDNKVGDEEFFTEVLSKYKKIHIKSDSWGNFVALNLVKKCVEEGEEIEWNMALVPNSKGGDFVAALEKFLYDPDIKKESLKISSFRMVSDLYYLKESLQELQSLTLKGVNQDFRTRFDGYVGEKCNFFIKDIIADTSLEKTAKFFDEMQKDLDINEFEGNLLKNILSQYKIAIKDKKFNKSEINLTNNKERNSYDFYHPIAEEQKLRLLMKEYYKIPNFTISDAISSDSVQLAENDQQERS